MKFRFKIQEYQTDAVDAVVRVFSGQGRYEGISYIRDTGKQNKGQISLSIGDEFDPENETGYKNEEMCIFGDRLYTDIALGKKHGVTAVLVYSGETTPEDVEAATVAEKPDYAFPSLDEVDQVMFG